MKNWKQAWDSQTEFDNRVNDEMGVNPTTADRCAAFRIEIAELANEICQNFKWWNKEANDYEAGIIEYVDGLKLLIGLGISLGVTSKDIHVLPIKTDGVKQLHSDCDWLSQLIERGLHPKGGPKPLFMDLFSTYVKLGYEIGFTTERITQAFEDKHSIINERLDQAK